MNSLQPRNIDAVFQSKPEETAAWLITLDSFAAIAPIAKEARIIEHETEIAAKRLVSSVGNGDFQTTFRYFTSPEKYPPGMLALVRNLGAVSYRGQLNPPLMAAVSYRLNKSARRRVSKNTQALSLYAGADSFPEHFQRRASDQFTGNEYASLADFVLAIKNETAFWIDKEVSI